jgi:hypothetical protein
MIEALTTEQESVGKKIEERKRVEERGCELL